MGYRKRACFGFRAAYYMSDLGQRQLCDVHRPNITVSWKRLVSNLQEDGCDRPGSILRLRSYPHIPNSIPAKDPNIVDDHFLQLLCGCMHECPSRVASPHRFNSRSNADEVYASPTILSHYLRQAGRPNMRGKYDTSSGAC